MHACKYVKKVRFHVISFMRLNCINDILFILRSLRDSDRKNKELESKIKRSHNELANYRMDLTAATQKNTQLLYVPLKCMFYLKYLSCFICRQEIECHKKCESERTYLKSKIKEVEELLKRNKHAPEQTKSIERIGATPMLRMSNFTNILDEAILEKVYSPTVVISAILFS